MLTRIEKTEPVPPYVFGSTAAVRRDERLSIRRDVEDFDSTYRLLTGLLVVAAALLILYGLF